MEKVTPKKLPKPKEAKHVLERATQCCGDCAHFKWRLLICSKSQEHIPLDKVYDPIECRSFDFK